MPARPFTRRQALQNAAFLEALGETGNPRFAARLLGVHRSTYTKRRAKNAAFAQDWDAALAAAHARFHKAGGAQAAAASLPSRPGTPEGTVTSDCPHRTRGGELFVGRTRGGRLQLRRAPPGWMTKEAEQAFFAALSATANVRLSAAAAGFSHSSFYAKAGIRAAFAREMRLALAMGCERIEWALTERAFQALGEGGGWRAAAGDENPLPKMTIDQCIQLVALRGRRDGRREPPSLHDDGEAAEQRRLAAAARARHYEASGSWRFPDEPPPPQLPPLDLVTGWSKAKGKPKHNPDLALFGGWRLKDWKKRKG